MTLGLLDAIEQRADISQRHLAKHMDIALGLANSYLRRCAKKGWVKVCGAPANRYFYYLTPKGLKVKARLTAKFLSTSFQFYRQAGESCTRVFSKVLDDGYQDIALCGLSDLAEIAYLRAMDSTLKVTQLVEPKTKDECFFGLPIVSKPEADHMSCAFLITDITDPVTTATQLLAQKRALPVYFPDILGVHIDDLDRGL